MINSVAALLPLLVFLLCPLRAFSQIPPVQATPTAKTLEDILTPDFVTLNDATIALFPLSIITAQTPIAVRYVLITALAPNEITAACHPVALSFFATKDPIPPTFCDSRLSRVLIMSHIIYRVLETEFPVEAFSWGAFLTRNGLNILDRTLDENTEVGWANVRALRLARYFATDGWNSLGDQTKMNYRQPFEDSSNYHPQNQPHLTPDRLWRPLRWQPLLRNDFHGDFRYQVHVTPHLPHAKTIALTTEEFERKQVDRIYETPNRWKAISAGDERTVRKWIDRLFKRSAQLTDEKIVAAFWWENKFFSLGTFGVVYQQILGYGEDLANRIAAAELIAQYDAVLLAWKEKRRHDLVRPTTLIRRLLGGQRVRAYKNGFEGVGDVLAEEWEPLIPMQPHSEYPSASATICTATMELFQVSFESLILNGTGTVPPFQTVVAPGFLPGNPIATPVVLKYDSLKEAARACGESRLDAGVHFEPAVTAGSRLGQGVGRKAFEHLNELYEGRVPKDCERCQSS